MLPVEAANLVLGLLVNSGNSYYAGLLTALPSRTDTEANLVEPGYGGYARVATTFNSTLWNTPADGASTNKIAIEFPVATSTASPKELIKGAFFVTASSGGTIVCAGQIIEPLEFRVGKRPVIPIGYLSIYAVYDPYIAE